MGQRRGSDVEDFFLVAFAICFDLLNWIPILNILVTAASVMIFQGYFWYKGMRGVASLAGNLAELIPGLSFLPALTAGVVATIIIDRMSARIPAVGEVAKSIKK